MLVIPISALKNSMKKNHQKNTRELPKLKSRLTAQERKKDSLSGKSKKTENSKKNLRNTRKMKSPSLKPKSKNLSEWSPSQHRLKKPITTKNNSTKPTKRSWTLSNNYQSKSRNLGVNWTSMILRAIQTSKRLTSILSRIPTTLRDNCYRMIQLFFRHSPVLSMQMPPSSMRPPKRIVERQKPTATKRSRKSRTRSRNSSSINSRSKSTASSKQLKDITLLLSTLKKPSRISFKPLNKKSKKAGTSI